MSGLLGLVDAARSGDAEAAAELQRQLLAMTATAWRTSPVSLASHLDATYHRARHLEALSDQLVRAAVEPGRRVVVSMPVRHGKSWLTSMWYVVWLLERWPTKRVILVGHTASFARRWGRAVRNLIRRHASRLRVRLVADMQAADCWETPEGGGMITAGVGGNINGAGGDVLLLDDYCKSSGDAYSKAWRDSLWEWWLSTAYTRLEPGASCVIVATRWHEDDLIGRLLAQDAELAAEDSAARADGVDLAPHVPWEQVVYPAVAEEHDALGRAPGEALWPARWPLRALARIRRTQGAWVWAALYQQRPSPAEGGMFRRSWLRYYTEPRPGVYRYRTPAGDVHEIARDSLTRYSTLDLATSLRTAADYTVCATWGLAPDGCLLMLGQARVKVEGPDLVPLIRSELERWGSSVAWIEAAGYQLSAIQHARRAGLSVRELRADKDKVARALPATADLEAGRVLLPASAEWLGDWEAEVLAFPGGAHDDQVDALAYAVQIARDLGDAPALPSGMPEDPDAWDDDEDEGDGILSDW